MRKTLSITAKLPDGEGGGGKVNPGPGRRAQTRAKLDEALQAGPQVPQDVPSRMQN
ncbi:MAG: hypothetical protein QG575_337 [Euryarchaeota archaeon]|nr:hypothetical protein [Euryarchaeota archaeon]